MYKEDDMVRRINFFAAFLLFVLASTSLVSASIIDWNCDDDGDGAIVMSYADLIGSGGDYTLEMDGKQYWYPAHMEGDFTTDTELDPTVWLIEEIENDTTFAWTDYHITIGMDKTFSILSTGLVAPTGRATVITT